MNRTIGFLRIILLCVTDFIKDLNKRGPERSVHAQTRQLRLFSFALYIQRVALLSFFQSSHALPHLDRTAPSPPFPRPVHIAYQFPVSSRFSSP